VYGFTLDQNVGEFVLSHNNIKIPDSGKIYSFNEGNYAMWTPGLKKYMDSLKVRARGDARGAGCQALGTPH
jgi:fructose-1,6-bisphosphatase I